MFCKCLLLLVSLGVLQAQAQTLLYEAGPMQVSQARSAAATPGTRVGAVYSRYTAARWFKASCTCARSQRSSVRPESPSR
jgi:hypothetical protein